MCIIDILVYRVYDAEKHQLIPVDVGSNDIQIQNADSLHLSLTSYLYLLK
jgi:hypothetical protein